ncbi:hypothetical protein BJX68DRAFT_239396 [Aspergillus pseudodeflectus]|uniref:Secreted protein n=1 Tax=Aspergillus pseudodeflectus TaxID=176178 RepID=A0ABR4K5L5_9EURO
MSADRKLVLGVGRRPFVVCFACCGLNVAEAEDAQRMNSSTWRLAILRPWKIVPIAPPTVSSHRPAWSIGLSIPPLS